MKFYLASRWQDRQESMKIRDFITNWLGWECTSRWLNGEPEAGSLEEKTKWSGYDLEDVDRADMLILYNPKHVHGTGSGGRHVEFGYAKARGKKLILIGWPENIFNWPKGVQKFNSATELVEEYKE